MRDLIAVKGLCLILVLTATAAFSGCAEEAEEAEESVGAAQLSGEDFEGATLTGVASDGTQRLGADQVRLGVTGPVKPA